MRAWDLTVQCLVHLYCRGVVGLEVMSQLNLSSIPVRSKVVVVVVVRDIYG